MSSDGDVFKTNVWICSPFSFIKKFHFISLGYVTQLQSENNVHYMQQKLRALNSGTGSDVSVRLAS
jgi:hypothetical protein